MTQFWSLWRVKQPGQFNAMHSPDQNAGIVMVPARYGMSMRGALAVCGRSDNSTDREQIEHPRVNLFNGAE